MCGRYTHLYTWRQLHRLLSLTTPMEFELGTRYNVAPTQSAPVVRATRGGGRELAMLRWGLIPSWAKDAKIGYSTINARAEGLAEKPAFRSAFKRRRCLVPVSGFYEWRKLDEAGTDLFGGLSASGRPSKQPPKQPYYITLADGEVMVLAGLWESWRDPTAQGDAKPLESYTIITTTPNEMMAKIHDRMPVIVDRRDFARWLDPASEDSAGLAGLLKPYPAELMLATPVSTRVNTPNRDGSECIQPIEGQ